MMPKSPDYFRVARIVRLRQTIYILVLLVLCYSQQCSTVSASVPAQFGYCTREKVLQNFVSSRDGPEKVQKQGRNERMQEDYPTSAKIQSRCRVVFSRFFISALFMYIPFSSPSLLEIKFCRKFFPITHLRMSTISYCR